MVYGVLVPGTDGRAGMASLSWTEKRFDGERVAQALRAALPAYAVPLFIRLRKEQEVTVTLLNAMIDHIAKTDPETAAMMRSSLEADGKLPKKN